MDSSTFFMVIGSGLIFILLMGWKIRWFIRKINAAPSVADED